MNTICYEDSNSIINGIYSLITDIRNRTFMIVGATSFLGASIIDALVYYNRNVATTAHERCYILAFYHNKEKAFHRFSDYTNDDGFFMHEWDATELNNRIDMDRHVDYVFYLCSIASTELSIKYPVETISANTIGLYSVLAFAKESNVRSVLYFSSGAIYGVPQGVHLSIGEADRWSTDHMDITNVYSEGKRIGETLCNSFFNEYKVPVRIVRISHTYGPGIDINDGRVFSDFVKNILKRENVVVKSDGSSTRPFCYITDAVIGFFFVLLRGTQGEAYNLANPMETYSVGELAELLTNDIFSDRRLHVTYLNRMGNIHPEKAYVDITKISRLGWKPQVTVREGFRRVVASMEENIR